jgi:hypothetical protein
MVVCLPCCVIMPAAMEDVEVGASGRFVTGIG